LKFVFCSLKIVFVRSFIEIPDKLTASKTRSA
jgi:hypothetical protein